MLSHNNSVYVCESVCENDKWSLQINSFSDKVENKCFDTQRVRIPKPSFIEFNPILGAILLETLENEQIKRKLCFTQSYPSLRLLDLDTKTSVFAIQNMNVYNLQKTSYGLTELYPPLKGCTSIEKFTAQLGTYDVENQRLSPAQFFQI